MKLTREQISDALSQWNQAWDDHDLDGVMALFHADVVFENWTGGKAKGMHDAGDNGQGRFWELLQPLRVPGRMPQGYQGQIHRKTEQGIPEGIQLSF